MTNTPPIEGNQEENVPTDPKIIEKLNEIPAATVGQTMDVSDVTISQGFPSADTERQRREQAEMQAVPYSMILKPDHLGGIERKKEKYEKIIAQAGPRALEEERHQCGLIIFNALLSEEGIARFNDCLEVLRTLYAGRRCPEMLFTESFKHFAQYCEIQMTGPNGEMAHKTPQLQSLSTPTPIPGAETTKPVETERGSIRKMVLAKLALKAEKAAEEARRERLAKATEKQKSRSFIEVTDENEKAITQKGVDSTRRTNKRNENGERGTLEDQIATAICARYAEKYRAAEDSLSRDEMLVDARELIENNLPAGETWNDETFYKIWNEIAAIGQEQD